MCGISGYISGNTFLENNSIKNTLSLMKRRGPDSQDFFQKNYQNKDVALLHSRLNIIDLNSDKLDLMNIRNLKQSVVYGLYLHS